MTTVKNKFYLIALLLSVTLAVIVITFWPKSAVDSKSLRSWINEGYTKQFCSVIYPRIATCVTISPNQCLEIADTQINNCIDESDMPSSDISQTYAKQIYDSLAACFSAGMHKILVGEYLVDTQQCIDLMR